MSAFRSCHAASVPAMPPPPIICMGVCVINYAQRYVAPLIALNLKKKEAENDNACLGKAGASKWSKLSIMVLQLCLSICNSYNI